MENNKIKKIVWEVEGFFIDESVSIDEYGKPNELFYEGKTLEDALSGHYTKTKQWTHKYNEDGFPIFDMELEALKAALSWAEEACTENVSAGDARVIKNRIAELEAKGEVNK